MFTGLQPLKYLVKLRVFAPQGDVSLGGPLAGVVNHIHPVAARVGKEPADGEQHRLGRLAQLQLNRRRLPAFEVFWSRLREAHIHVDAAIARFRVNAGNLQFMFGPVVLKRTF